MYIYIFRFGHDDHSAYSQGYFLCLNGRYNLFLLLLNPTRLKYASSYIRYLFLARPSNLNYHLIATDLASIDSVVGLHNLQIWGLTSEKFVLAVHLVTGKISLKIEHFCIRIQ